jgi:hypothetical protein
MPLQIHNLIINFSSALHVLLVIQSTKRFVNKYVNEEIINLKSIRITKLSFGNCEMHS